MNLYLLWGAIQDLKEKKISRFYLNVGVILGILFFIGEIRQRNLEIVEVLLSFLPGIIFLLIAKISKEKIGYGDGWLFLIIACWMEARETWILWQLSLFISSVFSFILIIIKKCNVKSSIAFIPFIWLGHLVLCSMIYGK